MLLPSSQPHHELWVQGLRGGVLVVPMALAKRGAVLDELGVDAGVGVRLRPVLRVEPVVRVLRLALLERAYPTTTLISSPSWESLCERKTQTWLEVNRLSAI